MGKEEDDEPSDSDVVRVDFVVHLFINIISEPCTTVSDEVELFTGYVDRFRFGELEGVLYAGG